MRRPSAPLLALSCLLLLAACQKNVPPPAAQTVKTAPLDTPKPEQPAPSACGDTLASVDGGTIADPKGFRGFSADGTQFAYSTYSEGAGANLLTILRPPEQMVERFMLEKPENVKAATEALQKAGFTATVRRPLFDVRLTADSYLVTVGGKELARGPVATLAGARATPYGCSMNGRLGAIELVRNSGTEFGNVTSYLLFETGAQR